MVLLSQLMRTAAITGRPDSIDASWFAGRQGGRWAEQTIRSAFPAPRMDEALRDLEDLRQRGVVTDAECERLRSRLHGGPVSRSPDPPLTARAPGPAGESPGTR